MNFHKDDGSFNETMILNTLDKHYFRDLSDKWKRHLRKMFNGISDGDYIRVSHYAWPDAKPDLLIMVGGHKAFLSVKSGRNPTMHEEPVKTFYKFLETYGVPEKIRKIMRFYHYGYTKVGSKYTRTYTHDEIIEKYGKYIKEVNEYFSNNKDLVQEIIYRSIITGRLQRDLIDYFYYGNPAKGFLLSRDDIFKIILSDTRKLDDLICFKQLTYVAGSRKEDSERRHKMKIHWPALCRYFYDESFNKIYG